MRNSRIHTLVPLFILIFLFTSCRVTEFFTGREVDISRPMRIGELHPDLKESSGLELLNDSLLSFNDSGGEARLFIFPPQTPLNIRTVQVMAAENADWEDVTADSLFLYIGDFGNNAGLRDTLTIYRIPLSNIKKGENPVPSQRITFEYAEKAPEDRKFRNRFDCESIFMHRDSLWILTKNWTDQSTWIYKLPTRPGHYRISASQKLNPGFLVTGADFVEKEEVLFLLGYRNFRPGIHAYKYNNSIFEQYFRIRLPNKRGLQTEGIVFDPSSHNLYFSHEKSRRKQGLYRLYIGFN